MAKLKSVFTPILLLSVFSISAQTNIWQGDFWPNAWSTPEAWSLNHVPIPAEDVIIPAGLTNYPFLVGSCFANDLVLHDGAEVEIRNGMYLHVYGNFEIAGTITHFGVAPEGDIIVDGYVKWHGTSLMEYDFQNPAFQWMVYGNWHFESGCEVDMNYHEVEFVGTNPVYIYTKSANAKFYRIEPNKSGTTVTWSNTSTYDLETNYLINRTNTTFQTWNTRSIIVKTFFTNSGTVQLHAGTFKWGYSGGTTSCDATDYFHDMELHPYYTTGTFFNGTVIVNGDFTAEYGGPSPGSLTFNDHLIVKGDFNCDMGNNLSISRLTFNGSGLQQCIGARCDTLVLEKVSGDELRIPSDSTIAGQYDWTSGWLRVNGGVLQAHDLIDPGILGTISLTSGAINFNQDASQFVDLRAYLFISNGTFKVTGGSGDSYWPWSDSASLVMAGGTLDFEQGIYIRPGTFAESITGGIIKTQEDFRVIRSDFNPTGGTILMYGGPPGQDTVRLQCNTGSNLNHLKIEKTGSIDVVSISDIDINGNISLSGGGDFKCDDHIWLKRNWYSTSFRFKGAGSTFTFDGTSDQFFSGKESFDTLILDNDFGTLFFQPYSYFNIDAFNWEGGAIRMNDAIGYIFDLLDYGIYGTYILENNALLNITQDLTQSLDINASISLLSDSHLNLIGGDGISDWANFTDASLTMGSGSYLHLQDNGVHIHNTNVFTENISAGYLHCEGDFICDRTNFTPLGGSVILGGEADLDLDMTSGSYFHDLWILNGNLSGTSGTVSALSNLLIQNDLRISRGAFAPMDVEIKGDWNNEIGPDAFQEGTYEVTFTGLNNSVLLHNENFYDLTIDKSSTLFESLTISEGDSVIVMRDCQILDGKIRMEDSTYLEVKDDLSINNGAGLFADFVAPVKFVIGDDWSNLNNMVDGFQGFTPGTSTVLINGYSDQIIEQYYKSGSFYDLIVENHDFDVQVLEPIQISHDISLIKGTLHAPDSMWVGGNWSNINGRTSFDPDTGIVIFNGFGYSDLLTDETFYDFQLAKNSTASDGFDIMLNITMSVLNNMEIYTGTMEMNDYSVLDIEGDLQINANAGLNAADDVGLEIYIGGDWSDQNTAWSNKIGFNPGNSRVTFDGADRSAVFCNATDADFYKLIIDKSSSIPTEDFVSFHTSIKVLNDVDVIDGRWYDPPAENNEHQFFNDLVVWAGAKWFGGNSTIIFKKHGDQKWSPSPSLIDNSFHHVTIDKPDGSVLVLEDIRSLNGGFLSVQSGTLDLNGNIFYVGGDAEVLVNGKVFTRTGGDLIVGNDPL